MSAGTRPYRLEESTPEVSRDSDSPSHQLCHFENA